MKRWSRALIPLPSPPPRKKLGHYWLLCSKRSCSPLTDWSLEKYLSEIWWKVVIFFLSHLLFNLETLEKIFNFLRSHVSDWKPRMYKVTEQNGTHTVQYSTHTVLFSKLTVLYSTHTLQTSTCTQYSIVHILYRIVLYTGYAPYFYGSILLRNV